jgi:hypothetical protein
MSKIIYAYLSKDGARNDKFLTAFKLDKIIHSSHVLYQIILIKNDVKSIAPDSDLELIKHHGRTDVTQENFVQNFLFFQNILHLLVKIIYQSSCQVGYAMLKKC